METAIKRKLSTYEPISMYEPLIIRDVDLDTRRTIFEQLVTSIDFDFASSLFGRKINK